MLIQAFVKQKQRVKARVSSKEVNAITQSHPLAPPELAGKWIVWLGDNQYFNASFHGPERHFTLRLKADLPTPMSLPKS